MSCLENDGYDTPELNEKLYLHFRGFRKIENLDEYVNCKALWLDSNGFDVIEGLDALVELRCLYLSKNLIEKICGLDKLVNLTIIDLSNNRIQTIDGLSCCPNLQTVNLSKNALTNIESLKHLTLCEKLDNIDLSTNKIEADENILTEVICKIPKLANLCLNGNDITRLPSFRKRLINATPTLSYLDRPVDAVERMRAIAFCKGGHEEEKRVFDAYRAEQDQKRIDEISVFRNWQEEHRKKSRAKLQSMDTGASLIKEMTPEELETRRLATEKAVAAEKEMLDIGVDRVAKKYWEIEHSAEYQNADSSKLLSASIESIKREDLIEKNVLESTDIEDIPINNARSNHEVAKSDGQSSEKPVDINTDTYTKAKSLLKPSDAKVIAADVTVEAPNRNATEEDVVLESVDIVMEVKAPMTDPMQQYQYNEEGVLPADDVESNEEDDRLVHPMTVEETPEEVEAREARVAASMTIFNKQMEIEREKRKQKNNATVNAKHINETEKEISKPYNDAEKVVETVPDVTPSTLYWTEKMDLLLAKYVKECFFDFNLISQKIITLQKKREFCEQLDRYVPDIAIGSAASHSVNYVAMIEKQTEIFHLLLSSDACRLRWSELDANRWSSMSEPSNLPINPKIYVNPSNITGSGHGCQPTFDQLYQQVASGNQPTNSLLSKLPSYLKAPTELPSVRTINRKDTINGVDMNCVNKAMIEMKCDDSDEDLDALD